MYRALRRGEPARLIRSTSIIISIPRVSIDCHCGADLDRDHVWTPPPVALVTTRHVLPWRSGAKGGGKSHRAPPLTASPVLFLPSCSVTTTYPPWSWPGRSACCHLQTRVLVSLLDVLKLTFRAPSVRPFYTEKYMLVSRNKLRERVFLEFSGDQRILFCIKWPNHRRSKSQLQDIRQRTHFG